VPTHPPSLNFCSSSNKAKPEAMQEIRDNTSVDPCSNLPNESMWPYLAVPTYLMELFVEFFTLFWVVERWNLSSVSLLLSLFLTSIGENMITMILWFLKIRHSGTLFFGMWFLSSAQQMFLLILPSNGTTDVMYIAKLKDGPKRIKRTFTMTLKRGFEMV
jgi:hypothetical protein